MCKVIEATLLCQISFCFVIYYGFRPKMGQNPYCSMELKFDDVTVKFLSLYCRDLFLQTHLDTVLLHAKICQD